jgi:hypothetical protein
MKRPIARSQTLAYWILAGLTAWLVWRYFAGGMRHDIRLGDVGIVCSLCFIVGSLAVKDLKPTLQASSRFISIVVLIGLLLGVGVYVVLQFSLPPLEPLTEYYLRLIPLALLVIWLLGVWRVKNRQPKSRLQ